jgi:hypothetical protein
VQGSIQNLPVNGLLIYLVSTLGTDVALCTLWVAILVPNTLRDDGTSLCGGKYIVFDSVTASLMVVPCSGNGVDGCGFCSATTKSSVAAASLPAEDVAGISTLFGKNLIVLGFCTPLVSGMYAL